MKKPHQHTPEEAAAERARRKIEAYKVVRSAGPKGIRREYIDQKLQAVLNELVDKKILIRFKKRGRGGLMGTWEQVWLRFNDAPPPQPVCHYPMHYEQDQLLHKLAGDKVRKQNYMLGLLASVGYQLPENHIIKWDQNLKRINVLPPKALPPCHLELEKILASVSTSPVAT